MKLKRRRLLQAGLAMAATMAAGGRAAQAPVTPRSAVAWSRRVDTGYSPQLAELLVRCCDLAGEQYHRSRGDARYDGDIRTLSEYQNYAAQLDRYQQISSFQLSQLSLSQLLAAQWSRLGIPFQNPFGGTSGDRAIGLESLFWGYALTSSTSNIIALRGTQTETEMATGASLLQVQFGSRTSRVHAGFYQVYQGLIDQLRQAAEQFDPELPCYITGYSLGGAVAVLTAATLAQGRLRDQIRVYTYAMPRVGNLAFAEFYDRLVPQTYRVVNQADLVPTLPPDSIQGASYADLGEPWFYYSQCGSFERNHAISTYRRGVDSGLQPQPQFQERQLCS